LLAFIGISPPKNINSVWHSASIELMQKQWNRTAFFVVVPPLSFSLFDFMI